MMIFKLAPLSLVGNESGLAMPSRKMEVEWGAYYAFFPRGRAQAGGALEIAAMAQRIAPKSEAIPALPKWPFILPSCPS
ncbi:MAG: hypothetical protein AAB150_19130 [Pseudomonadota bacterium]